MPHQYVANDFPTISGAPTCALADTISVEILGRASREIYDAVNSCSDTNQLDNIGSLLWRGYFDGNISEREAEYLQSVIELRRPLKRPNAALSTTPLGSVSARIASRFAARQPKRSPDRKASRDRRRKLGGSSALPDTLRTDYTEGQRSVLCIVASEVKRHGICDFPIDKIAALAGVCRTTVQTTMHEARRLRHIKITERPRPGHKSLPNIVEIISLEWRTWIKRAPLAASSIGSNSLKIVSTTKNKEVRKKGAFKEKSVGDAVSHVHVHTLAPLNRRSPTPSERLLAGEADVGGSQCAGIFRVAKRRM